MSTDEQHRFLNALGHELESREKHDIVFVKHTGANEVFPIVNGIAREWERDGVFIVKTDGVAVKEPYDPPEENGEIVALVQGAYGLPDFLEEIAASDNVWVVFTANGDPDAPDNSFNRCAVRDLR